MTATPDSLAVALRVTAALDRLGVASTVGRSIAASFASEPRSTIDIVAALDERAIAPFVEALASEFYVDEEAVRRAVVTRTSVNLIHHETHLKVALFAAGGTPLDAQQLARRKRIVLPDGREICIHPPEDILLQKLRWYRLGGEVSDRQWRDVLDIVRTQQERLDREYLAEGALALDVGDLLERRQAPSSRWLSPTRSETRCSRRLAPLIETDATIGIWCAGSLCSAASATLSRASCPSSRLRSPPLKSIDLARYFELRSNAAFQPRRLIVASTADGCKRW